MTRMSGRLGAAVVFCALSLAPAVADLHAGAQEIPLIEAAKRGEVAAVRTLIQQGADANTAEPDGTTALHWAADAGSAAVVDLLVTAGAKATTPNRYGATPAGLAADKGHAAVLKRLLTAGEDARAVVLGEPLLMKAARAGGPEAVKMLLAHGADPNVRESTRNQTPLMWAAAAGHAAVIEVLIEAGGEVHARSDSSGKGLEKTEDWISQYVPKNKDPLQLRANRDPHWIISLDGLRFTPLMWAARAGHIEAVKALLDGGANVNDAKPEGTTVLLLALINHHWELASYLLDRGADPNRGPGYTALHQLAWSRRLNINFSYHPGFIETTGNVPSIEVAKRLIARGVNVNAKMTEGFRDNFRNRFTRVGSTAFMLASKLVDVPLMRLLLEHGADRRILNADDDTPLMAAAGVGLFRPAGEDAGNEAETLAAVKILLELGEDIHAVNKNGETVLHGAAYRSIPAVVQYLIDQGAKLDVRNVLDWTPLTIADGVFYGGILQASAPTAKVLRENYARQGLPVPPPAKLVSSVATEGQKKTEGETRPQQAPQDDASKTKTGAASDAPVQ